MQRSVERAYEVQLMATAMFHQPVRAKLGQIHHQEPGDVVEPDDADLSPTDRVHQPAESDEQHTDDLGRDDR